jgi:hypothetical protein
MAIDWKKRLARLKALDPNNVDLKAWRDLGINPMGYYRVNIEHGDTFDNIMNNFAKSYGLDLSLVRACQNAIVFNCDYDDVCAHFEYQLSTIELRHLLDTKISKIERTIKRAEAQAKNGPTKKQLREQDEKQKRDAALAKLSAEDRKILGIKG